MELFGQHERISSEAMGRRMHLWRFGHYGAPLLVLPSAAGVAHEWESDGRVATLAPLIAGGRLKLYCTESNVAESWTDWDGDPAYRVQRHQAFERYLVDELVPYIREDCRTADLALAAAGASLGAYFAANLVLKYPEIFSYALCMSGRYDARWLTAGFENLDVYYNNPVTFVPNLEGDELDRVRSNVHLDLVCGRGAWEGGNLESTENFGAVLASKGISHRCDVWGDDVTHEPQWWNRQATHYLGQRFAG